MASPDTETAGRPLLWLGCVALAAVAAGLLAAMVTPLGASFAVVIGAVVLVGGVVVIDLLDRRRADRALNHRLAALALAQTELATRLAKLEDPRSLDPETVPSASGSEVRMLQDVVDALVSEPEPLSIEEDLTDDTVLRLLRDAVRKDRIEVFTQPIVSLPQRRALYVELLSRIRMPDDRHLPADRYIDIARREGLVDACDNLLLLRAIQLMRDTRDRLPNLGFFCNIAGSTLRDQDFMQEMLTFLDENADLARRLVLELEATDLLAEDAQVATAIDRLVDMGVRMSVDRIGDTAVDIERLIARRVSFVKMKAPLLLDLLETEGEDEVSSLVGRLRKAGIEMVAERIESERVLVELLDFDIELGQGFLFGEPQRREGEGTA